MARRRGDGRASRSDPRHPLTFPPWHGFGYLVVVSTTSSSFGTIFFPRPPHRTHLRLDTTYRNSSLSSPLGFSFSEEGRGWDEPSADTLSYRIHLHHHDPNDDDRTCDVPEETREGRTERKGKKRRRGVGKKGGTPGRKRRKEEDERERKFT